MARALERQENISQDAKDLVCALIKNDPKLRFSAIQALESAWMAEDYNSEKKKLDGVRERAMTRKNLKDQRNSQNVNLERVPISEVLHELTKYGIDFSRNGDGSGIMGSRSLH